MSSIFLLFSMENFSYPPTGEFIPRKTQKLIENFHQIAPLFPTFDNN